MSNRTPARALRAAVTCLFAAALLLTNTRSVAFSAYPVVVQTPVGEVSFARDVQPIFDAFCSCHTGSFRTAGLDLSAGKAYASIVNARSGQVRELKLVEPGDPPRSYLWHKVNGTQFTVGGGGWSMPADGPTLPEETLVLLRQWIEQGAPDN